MSRLIKLNSMYGAYSANRFIYHSFKENSVILMPSCNNIETILESDKYEIGNFFDSIIPSYKNQISIKIIDGDIFEIGNKILSNSNIESILIRANDELYKLERN